MALLIWAAWVVTKKVESEKLKVENAFQLIALLNSNNKIKESPSVYGGTFLFNLYKVQSRLVVLCYKRVQVVFLRSCW
jgi:hypothetical protein